VAMMRSDPSGLSGSALMENSGMDLVVSMLVGMNERMNELMNKMIHKDEFERMIKEEVEYVNSELRKVRQELIEIKGAEGCEEAARR